MNDQNQAAIELIDHRDTPESPGEGGHPEILILCEHASNRVPSKWQSLGLTEDEMNQHYAVDIGTSALSKAVAERLGCCALLAGYSRLFLDLNRVLEDATLIPDRTTDRIIPGNKDLSDDERGLRIAAAYTPFHDTASSLVDELCQRFGHMVIVSIHSFTPVMNGEERPHGAVIFDDRPDLAHQFAATLSDDGRYTIGENEPYSGYEIKSPSFEMYAKPRNLGRIGLEVRQDLLVSEHSIQDWADRIATCAAEFSESCRKSAG